MSNEQESAYHRTFLSTAYLENLNPSRWLAKLRRPSAEVKAIRLSGPGAFEKARKSLAQLLELPYRAGFSQEPRDDQGGTDWVSGTPSDAQVAECMAPLCQPQGAVRSPTSGMVCLPIIGYTFKAYMHGTPLHAVDMYEKMDQQFEDYATPWELGWSNLTYPYDRGFTPIVDRSFTVIGYVGTAQGRVLGQSFGQTSLILPREFAGKLNLGDALARGVPVFVHSGTGLPSGWANGNFYSSDHKIQVRTGINGEVLDFQVIEPGFVERPRCSRMSIVTTENLVGACNP